MAVGYLPDMFSHIAQMPQLLRLAGLDHAVVWRGVPSAVDRTAFWWEALDGSRVRAEYLYGSYSNGRDLPDDAKQLVARAHGYLLELGNARLPDGDVLLMNGSDHLLPQPWLGSVVAEANRIQDDYQFVVTSVPEYVVTQPTAGLPLWRGELRSGARANVLMGVASNRVDVHQLCAAAERAVERRAEPLSTLFLPEEGPHHRLLDLAWRNLVLNSAHDSACACSHDEVVEAVRVRYQEARHLGEAVARDSLRRLASQIDTAPGSTIVVNPTARPRDGVVVVYVPDDDAGSIVDDEGRTCPMQVIRTFGGEGLSTIVTGQKIRWVLELVRGPEFAGARIAEVARTHLPDGTHEYVFRAAGPLDEPIDLEAVREELLELGNQDATIRIRQVLAPMREVAFLARGIPGFGWRTFRVSPDAVSSGREQDAPPPARAEGTTLDNGQLVVNVDADDGTLSLRTADGVTITGANRLVDGGDGGDTYNYSPPAEDTIIAEPQQVRVSVLEAGPVRAQLLVESRYRWPSHALGNAHACSRRSDDTVDVEVRTTLELRTGEPFLRIHTEIDNRARDHRLRAHVPLPKPVTGSDAECAFGVVRRGLTAEGGPHEAGLPTFVSRRFVDCSNGDEGVALLHDGLLEYEVVDDGREVALTLLRATGYLSRAEPELRPNPAGPVDPLEGPQLQRTVAVDYALFPHRGRWPDADLHAASDAFMVPLERVRGGGWPGATRPPRGQALRVGGAQVSAIVRESGAMIVRLYNPADDDSTTASVALPDGPAAGWIVDLRGRPLERFEGEVELRAGQIVTLRLDA